MAASNGTSVSTAGMGSAWNRFWFQPTDPTTLGFIRIITGLVVIYVHLAYCFDLQNFFGEGAWWDLHAATQERKEFPVVVYDWQRDTMPQAPFTMPVLYDQRVAVFDFLKHLPQDKKQRDEVLEFLYFILPRQGSDEVSEGGYHQALKMLRDTAPVLMDDRAKIANELAASSLSTSALPITLPDFFLQMTPADRVRTWNQALKLLEWFPKPGGNFIAVLSWLDTSSPGDRTALANFLHKLEDGEAGQQRLEYIDRWHQDPKTLYAKGRHIVSIWFHVGDPAAMWFFHFAFIGIYCLFTLGLWTRVTSVLTWLAALSYIQRTQQVLFGMDTMMNVLLFYLMIGPSGAALSLDRLLARYRAARAIAGAGGKPVPWAEAVLAGPRPSALANFTIRLIQIHFCFIYAASGLAKLKGTSWWNSNAAWYTMANPEFCPVQYPFYKWMLFELASVRPVLAVVLLFQVYYTLFLEISFPFLVWTRLRAVWVCMAVFLHAGIAWMMGLTCFGLLMLTLLLSYIPAATIRERIGWERGAGPRLTLRFNSRHRGQARAAGILRALDLSAQLTLVDNRAKPNSEDAPLELVDAQGNSHTGYDAVRAAFRELLFARAISWVLWVPGISLVLRSFCGGNAVLAEETAADVATASKTKTTLTRS